MAPLTRLKAGANDKHEQEVLFSTATAYKNQALEFLKFTFPTLSVASIRHVLKDNNFSFTPSYRVLARIDAIAQEQRNAPERTRSESIRRDFPVLEPVSAILIKNKRYSRRPMISNAALQDEIGSIDELNQKEKGGDKENMAPLKEAPSYTREPPGVAAAASAAKMESPPPTELEIECECCFGEYPFEDMVQCNNGLHLFCSGCLKSHVSEQLFGNDRVDFKCMSLDGCDAQFHNTMLDKALTPRIRRKTDECIYRAEVLKANVDDLWTCPKCDFMMIVPANITEIVKCPEESCQHQSCRLCREEAHENQTCEEAKSEKAKSDIRTRMADAMTAAVVRDCPGCKNKIMKSTGCNKMTCTVCKTKFCYVCREKIENYDHFCRTPHCNHATCGMCVLFSNTDEDDRRARREAATNIETDTVSAADLGFVSPVKKEAKKCSPTQPARQLEREQVRDRNNMEALIQNLARQVEQDALQEARNFLAEQARQARQHQQVQRVIRPATPVPVRGPAAINDTDGAVRPATPVPVRGQEAINDANGAVPPANQGPEGDPLAINNVNGAQRQQVQPVVRVAINDADEAARPDNQGPEGDPLAINNGNGAQRQQVQPVGRVVINQDGDLVELGPNQCVIM